MRIELDGNSGAQASVVALGMFDGVHVGHRVLLDKTKVLATRLGVPMVVQTFAQHPLTLIDPDRCPPLLTTLAERAALIEARGADIFSADPFTEALRDMPPEDFVGHLVRRWKPKAVVVGFNYSFGRQGAGSPAFLHELGKALGFETIEVPPIRVGAAPASASRIREALARGDVRQARVMLGRPYQREMRMVASLGGRLALAQAQNGKQIVGKGAYRGLLCAQDKVLPAQIQIRDDGRVSCTVAGTVAAEGDLSLRFIAQVPQPGVAYPF